MSMSHTFGWESLHSLCLSKSPLALKMSRPFRRIVPFAKRQSKGLGDSARAETFPASRKQEISAVALTDNVEK